MRCWFDRSAEPHNSWGTPILKRDTDGRLYLKKTNEAGAKQLQGYFAKQHAKEVKKRGVAVFDSLMITELLTCNGECVGAMGLHVPTGAIHVTCSAPRP